MRDKFSQLIEQGVANFTYTKIGNDVPTNDPICRQYNNIFSMALDTHMDIDDMGRRVITGHQIGIKKNWDLFLVSPTWGGIDFRTSGFYCLNDFLYKNGLDGHYETINNDNVYVVEPIKDPRATEINVKNND